MSLEFCLFAYEFGFALNSDENWWLAEQTLASYVGKSDSRVRRSLLATKRHGSNVKKNELP